ncbi:MAG: cbb3-type cytochrome c oxidase subunit 3 [Burkholderiales bacterium]|nr:cbb3-type cytochrome c oxidase subunit 3 [Burkholderiales bacterium]
MDIDTLRIAVTLASLVAFLGIVAWAYWPARRQEMENKGRSILEDGAP